MGIIINAVKARIAIIAIVNAAGAVACAVGKGAEWAGLVDLDKVGEMADVGIYIFGTLATVLPSVNKWVQVEK